MNEMASKTRAFAFFLLWKYDDLSAVELRQQTQEKPISNWYESKATIIDGCARIVFVLWWANQCSCGRDSETCSLEGDGDETWSADEPHTPNDPGMGAELCDLAPATPDDATEWANRLIFAVECHGKKDIRDIYKVAATKARGSDPSPERFGECIGFSACGTGVSWMDDHPDSGAQVPSFEYNGSDGDAYIDTRFWSKV